MPDLNDLNLTQEDPVEVNWDAPESDQFPPRVYPGEMTVGFKLDEQKPFDAVERGSGNEGDPRRPCLEVNWTATVSPVSSGASFVSPPEPGSPDVEIPFQRHNAYKHPKRLISDMDDLLRHLGQRLEGRPTPQQRMEAFRQADGRATVFVSLGWSAYCKACADAGKPCTVATYKRKDSSLWPKNGDNRFALTAPCPGCGRQMYGREEVRRFSTKPVNGAA